MDSVLVRVGGRTLIATETLTNVTTLRYTNVQGTPYARIHKGHSFVGVTLAFSMLQRETVKVGLTA